MRSADIDISDVRRVESRHLTTISKSTSNSATHSSPGSLWLPQHLGLKFALASARDKHEHVSSYGKFDGGVDHSLERTLPGGVDYLLTPA